MFEMFFPKRARARVIRRVVDGLTYIAQHYYDNKRSYMGERVDWTAGSFVTPEPDWADAEQHFVDFAEYCDTHGDDKMAEWSWEMSDVCRKAYHSAEHGWSRA